MYRGRDSLLFVPVPDVADDVPALRPFDIDGKEEEEVVVVQGHFRRHVPHGILLHTDAPLSLSSSINIMKVSVTQNCCKCLKYRYKNLNSMANNRDSK